MVLLFVVLQFLEESQRMSKKLKVLFLCTGNSCRSQMAEGLARYLKADVIESYSAGTSPKELNQYAVRVMDEIGIDISKHEPKTVEDIGDVKFDFVVTVCSDAYEHCPIWNGNGKIVHHAFDDPPRLAVNAKTEEEALLYYRRVRDEIKSFILLELGLKIGYS